MQLVVFSKRVAATCVKDCIDQTRNCRCCASQLLIFCRLGGLANYISTTDIRGVARNTIARVAEGVDAFVSADSGDENTNNSNNENEHDTNQ
jgi:hypothetical protein